MMMDYLLDAKITPFSESEKRSMYSLKPSEYFHRQCWVGATNTDALGWCTSDQRDALGTDRIMWGSDYPHMESAWPETRSRLREIVKGIDEDEVRAMVGGNAVRCYGIDADALAPTVEKIGPTVDEIVSI
jgi:hypothetical protein